ncbi:MAG: CNNM domain-containing protein [Planctomycetota bacterium]
MTDYLPYLLAMVALALASGVFSCSEAALFYLRREDREQLAAGGPGERAAERLLRRPERLLTSILFWNLVINLSYFAISSLLTLRLERAGDTGAGVVLGFGSLLGLIIVSEMVPKNLGVLLPRQLAGFLGGPMEVAARVLDPILPALGKASDFCERLIAPKFENEAYLELSDLERAIDISGNDPELIEQEQQLLERVVGLSDATVEEVMRSRKEYLAFTPPVTAHHLAGQATPSGYLLITEADSEELAAALPISQAPLLPPGARLDRHARPVALAPWCATSASVLNELRRSGRRVAAVINELGETIGVVTLEDLLASALDPDATRRLPGDRPARLSPEAGGAWLATGRTTIRRVGKQLSRRLPATRSITIAGMLQEQLSRMPEKGDRLRWGGLTWVVTDVVGHIHIELRIEQTDNNSTGDAPPTDSNN